MRYTAALLVAGASYAAAQTTSAATPATSSTGSNYPCVQAIENIVLTCKSTGQIGLDACQPNDYGCLCAAIDIYNRCYNDCPQDPAKVGDNNRQIIYCNAADAAASQSAAAQSTRRASGSSAAAAASATSTATTSSDEDSPSNTASSSADAASSTGAAAGIAVPITGFMAVALSFFGML
ncbi:hypothetical protein K402DRAFT_419768 [Aulographum hederae CBS 113979]|uniref:Extracellular membrane protein CFEM domain-containing protein n=1 Tax=Aulographum hederae CBS 113979 TaxID=1176131 RepID=A0A6G1H4G8_9PEZI|nr:hypothetical protein K402DRAFT_419768 [Aulographum hederae CBS 113979]